MSDTAGIFINGHVFSEGPTSGAFYCRDYKGVCASIYRRSNFGWSLFVDGGEAGRLIHDVKFDSLLDIAKEIDKMIVDSLEKKRSDGLLAASLLEGFESSREKVET